MRIKQKTQGQKIADTMVTKTHNICLNICSDDGIYTIKEWPFFVDEDSVDEDSTLSIENVMKICREDEQNQLAEMLGLQEEANKNNQEFNKSNMK